MRIACIAGFVASVASFGVVSTAVADVADDRWYVSPMFTYTDEDDRSSNNGQGGTITIGKPINQFWNVEGAVFGSEFDADGPGEPEYEEYGVKVNALRMLRRNGWTPYLTGGLGLVRTERDDNGGRDSTDPMAEVGAGVMVPINDYGFGVRAEGLYRYIDYDSNVPRAGHIDERQYNIGLVVPLEPPQDQPLAEPEPVASREPELYDADGDGVHDKIDACPDSAPGLPVDRHGCALLAAAPAHQHPPVYNTVPVHYTTPAPRTSAPVYIQSAPTQRVVRPATGEYRHEYVEPDTDGDGVPDRLDACANSQRGTPVNDIGCGVHHR